MSFTLFLSLSSPLGNILCGIVGTKRVKFDVWSNDVSFANKMESTGHPDLVHISEETKKFLDDSYNFRESEQIDGHKTYFILSKKTLVQSPSDQGSLMAENRKMFELQVATNRQHRNLSTNDIPSMTPLTMSPSPSGHNQPSPQNSNHKHQHSQPPTAHSKSLSPSPVLNVRKHRLASISETVSRFLSSARQERAALSDQQKALLESRKGPNPTIVIGISEETSNHHNNNSSNNINNNNCKGTNIESPLSNQQTQHTATTNNLINCKDNKNSSCNNIIIDCDSKLVPYNNGSGGMPMMSTLSPSEMVNGDATFSEIDNCQEDFPANCADDEDDGSSLNITDLRSYISQSRCDVSPFSRTGSNRSDKTTAPTHNHHHHHHNHHHRHHRSCSQQSNSLSPWYPPQEISSMLSPSRKDSGIKSNSRRSSIQPNLCKNSTITTNRVSGYYTSSQSSLAPGNDSNLDDSFIMKHLPSPATGSFQAQPGCETLKACVQHLRKQSDLQLIKCVRDNARSQRSYLVKPPIRKFSLSFENSQMEKTFRNKAHRYESEANEMNISQPTFTLTTPKFNTFIDVFILTVIFTMIALSLFLLSPSIYSKEYKVWVCCFVVFSSLILTILFLCMKQILRRPRRSRNFNSIFGWCSKFYPWNFFGSILISLPVASILVNFALVDLKKFPTIQFYYGLLLFVCLIHFCNFIQLNCWTKNIHALISGMMFILIGYNHREISIALNDNYHREFMKNFITKNVTSMNSSESTNGGNAEWFKNYEVELCLDLVLVLILVFLLNREFEIGYRLSFYGNEVANRDKIKVQNMKNQADMLLHNIIPKHVAEELKNTAKYSKNHQDVGIVFASIVNFNEMYDESYLGGKEFLRVLNELIAGMCACLVVHISIYVFINSSYCSFSLMTHLFF